MLLEVLALVLAGAHFGTPLVYYGYMKKYAVMPWNIKTSESYRPRITIIAPTYNESEIIDDKLADLFDINYPHNLMQVVVVDDGSDDGTADRVEMWTRQHLDFDVKLIRKDAREGKRSAINAALQNVDPLSEVIILTDADAYWQREALSNVLSYFADPIVGCVTGCMTYTGRKVNFEESTYRSFYNLLRIAESKKHGTPIHNGPLLALRMEIIRRRGLPNYPGSDDSVFGSFVAFMGYRAIQAENVMVTEPIRGSQFRRKIRRANRLLLNFLNTKRYARNLGVYVNSPFDRIWKVEWWLHVVNPWLLVLSVALLAVGILFLASLAASILLGVGLVLLALKWYRMWVFQQVYLIVARLRGFWTKDVMWSR